MDEENVQAGIADLQRPMAELSRVSRQNLDIDVKVKQIAIRPG